MIDLRCGDCLEILKTLDAGSVDAVVTDPPAGIGFMGKAWDTPKGYGFRDGARRVGEMPAGLASARNPVCRTCRKHVRGKPPRPVCMCETPDPDISDGVRSERDAFVAFLAERLAAASRVLKPGGYLLCWAIPRTSHWTGMAIEEAGFEVRDRVSHLFGQGFPKAKSCLKPACEDWWLARKPGPRVLPLQIDAGRIAFEDDVDRAAAFPGGRLTSLGSGSLAGPGTAQVANRSEFETKRPAAGRWPANVCLSHHAACDGTCHPDCPVAMLGAQAGERKAGAQPGRRQGIGFGSSAKGTGGIRQETDAGTAARFFYTAKASRADRGEGNTHPTVKSTDLMRWLCRLVCPPGGTVLDPFLGSGSTGKACVIEGFGLVGIEQDPGYFAIAKRRIAAEQQRTPLFAASPEGGPDP